MDVNYLINLFGGLRQALEILYVMNGFKKTTRIIIAQDAEINLIKNFVENKNLNMEVSTLKYITKKDGNKTLYTSYSEPVKLNHKKEGLRYLYISKSKKLSLLARVTDEHQHTEEFGKILGYPECCIEFYNRNIQICLREKKDLMHNVLDETNIPFPYPFWNNFVARCFDVSFLSHYPCSFNCKESIKIAKERLQLIRSILPSLAEYIIKQLKSAIVSTSSIGIYKLNNFIFHNDEIYFKNKDIASINNSYLGDILKKSTMIKVVSKRRLIFIQGKRVLKDLRGKNVGVFIFN